jgi:hypothetical protein
VGKPTLSFEKRLREEVEAAVDDIQASTKKRPMAAGSKFVDIVLRVAKQIGAEQLKDLDKDAVIAVVSKVYDEYIAKIDLPGEYDAVFHGLIKQASLAALAIAYDQFLKK